MDRRNMSFRRMPFSFMIITLGEIICIWLAYLLCSFFFHYTGTPSVLWQHIIIILLGLYIFWGVVKLGLEFQLKQKGKNLDFRHQAIDDMLDALNRIASGDFSVILESSSLDPLSELTDSVNKMARELGSMEKLRQDFISNVSHEIQSPLTSISGFASLLKNNAISPDQRNHYLNIIETEAKRLSRLSDNLLKLSALENNTNSLTLIEFRLDKQIQNAFLILEPQWLSKQINITLDLDSISIIADENLLMQVWVNLIHNAIKFTSELGNIEMKLLQRDKEVIFTLTDSGIGISKDDIPHIFERFYKADKARDRSIEGNGLGLSLAKKIIDLHKGTIWVESVPNQGTTFNIKLPC